jgi:hypothetical protein
MARSRPRARLFNYQWNQIVKYNNQKWHWFCRRMRLFFRRAADKLLKADKLRSTFNVSRRRAERP